MQTEDICPGTKDFLFAREGKDAFAKTAPNEIVGFISCGGCPGKKAVARAMEMEERGAEAIFIASCASCGLPWNYPCPHLSKMVKAMRTNLSPKTKIIGWTHK